MLQCETRVEWFLRETFLQSRPPSVILTGNAGDGKTYLCRQVIAMLNGGSDVTWNHEPVVTISYKTLQLHVVKDLSELSDEQGQRLLGDLAESLQQPDQPDRYLMAANEGRLRALLAQPSLQELHRQIDEQLSNGSDLEHERLIVINLTDVSTSSFVQETLAWMSEPRLLAWLPHCRRKLFFKWQQTEHVDHLIPFEFLNRYLQLLEGNRSALQQARNELIVGLNRAFSRLYLTDTTYLYVTSQYLNTTEQPRPLVRVKFPVDSLALDVQRPAARPYNNDHNELWLIISAPPQLNLLKPGQVFEPLRWRVGLLSKTWMYSSITALIHSNVLICWLI